MQDAKKIARTVPYWILVALYIAAAILIGRAAVTQNTPPFSLDDYACGLAPMPYQARYLMVPILRWAGHNGVMIRAAQMFSKSALGPKELLLQVVDSACLIGMGWLTVRIRRRFLPLAVWKWMAPALLLWVVAVTFAVRYDQRLFLPYDFVSMLMFNIGVVACLESRGWLLVFALAIGTYNRETMILLIPLWLALHWRWNRRAIGWALAGIAIWIGAELNLHFLVHRVSPGFQFNWNWNLAAVLLPHHWAQLLSVGGYLVLPMWFRRDLVRDERLRRTWLGCVPFLVAALIFGVWNETRIFGELSVLIAVTAATQFEQLARTNMTS